MVLGIAQRRERPVILNMKLCQSVGGIHAYHVKLFVLSGGSFLITPVLLVQSGFRTN